jgi:hypothetical protein
MKLITYRIFIWYTLVWLCLILVGCKCDDDPMQPSSIVYKPDSRSVRLGDPIPIVIDVNEDGQMDFTIFMELTANSQGDRLYAGINPLGANKIKSGPPIDENFLNMGFLIAEPTGATIDSNLMEDELWTTDHSTLVIRNTFTNGNITYEGDWADTAQIVGIQTNAGGSIYYGWMRIDFDKATEIVTLIDFAYDTIPGQGIGAGAY